MFNFNHLYYFYITAKSGGVMKAAKILRIAQPSLTTQLKTLEMEIDRKLFQKVGRRLSLTAEGERVYGYCRKLFETAEDFEDYLKQSNSKTQRRINIGVDPQIERPFVADALVSVFRETASDALVS